MLRLYHCYSVIRRKEESGLQINWRLDVSFRLTSFKERIMGCRFKLGNPETKEIYPSIWAKKGGGGLQIDCRLDVSFRLTGFKKRRKGLVFKLA